MYGENNIMDDKIIIDSPCVCEGMVTEDKKDKKKTKDIIAG